MSACKTLVRTSLSSLECKIRSRRRKFSSISLGNIRSISANSSNLVFASFLSRNRGLGFHLNRDPSRSYGCVQGVISLETSDCVGENVTSNSVLELPDDSVKETVKELLSNNDDVARLMKMERRSEIDNGSQFAQQSRWFPYLDKFKSGSMFMNSGEVIDAIDPYILDVRKERIREVVKNRSYSVCLVIEGLTDFGNVSAAFRSADALGFQSVHVVSCDSTKRCNSI